MLTNDIPFPPDIPKSKMSEPEFLSQQSSPNQVSRELHQGGMPSPTPSMPRQPVGNQPSNELPATEPARGSNNNFRQLPLNQPLNQPPTQPAYQPAQQRPEPHEEPMGTPQATDWYNNGNRNNVRYPGNHQDERPNDFRTRNGDRGNVTQCG